jgi:transposase-like protein
MTAEELRRAAIALFGERGWMSRLAEALGVDRSTVSRWFGGLPIPGPAAAAVTALLELQRLKSQISALIEPPRGPQRPDGS